MTPVVLGITGGSGSVLALRTVDELLSRDVPTALICSNSARMVWQDEIGAPFTDTLSDWQENPGSSHIATALWVTKFLHLCAAVALLAVGLWLDLGFYYFIGWAIAVTLLIFENSLVRANNLSKLSSPFFRYNSVISMLLLIFTILAVSI